MEKKFCFKKKLSIRLRTRPIFCLVQFLFANTCFALSPENVSLLQKEADATFESIAPNFQSASFELCSQNQPSDACNYWQLGNSFDTILDYFDTNPEQSKVFADSILSSYPILSSPKNISGPACWYDDFGWWAVATERALQSPSLNLWTSEQKEQLGRISRETWDEMQIGTQVWELCRLSQDCMGHFQNFEPRFFGGIWNYFWFSESGKPYPGVCNTDHADPNLPKNALTGRQNTVTNGLYANAAFMRLNSQPKNNIYLQQSKRIHTFLKNWMELDHFDTALIKKIDENNVVVRERVAYYKNNSLDSGYVSDLSWAADSAFILNETLLYMQSPLVTQNEKAQLLQFAKNILNGSRQYFTNYNQKNIDADLLFSWSHSTNPQLDGMGNPPGNDPWDYNTGISVFLRYLLAAYKTNPELKSYMVSLGYPNMIYRAALNALKNQGLCSSDEKCSHLVRNTNKLAILVTAIEMKTDM